ncbi:MAG: 50S ribosomal protein L14e [Candidatus Hydrothermarchaeales archaeon]
MIIEVGRVCVKLAGREAGKRCAIVEVIDKNFVTVAGKDVRRRRCNINHLEPLDEVIKIKKGASDEEIAKSLK